MSTAGYAAPASVLRCAFWCGVERGGRHEFPTGLPANALDAFFRLMPYDPSPTTFVTNFLLFRCVMLMTTPVGAATTFCADLLALVALPPRLDFLPPPPASSSPPSPPPSSAPPSAPSASAGRAAAQRSGHGPFGQYSYGNLHSVWTTAKKETKVEGGREA